MVFLSAACSAPPDPSIAPPPVATAPPSATATVQVATGGPPVPSATATATATAAAPAVATAVDPKDADRRVDLQVSGGKSGQGSETLVFSKAAQGCSVLKILTDVPGTPGALPERRELVEVPCADFDRVFQFATDRFSGKRTKGTLHDHAVLHSVTLWKKGPNDAPVIEEISWTGSSPMDDTFGQLAGIAGAVAASHGTLRLGRLVPSTP